MSKLDICADILSLSKYEMIIYHILTQPKGLWVPLKDIAKHQGFLIPDIEEIYACYIEDIKKEEGFELLLFCDESSMDILSASYNKSYLMRKIQQKPVDEV